MRDVNLGWLIRYIHANGASFFFGCMYIHIGKALYYGSYRKPRVLVWIIGVIILIATMATGFMGKKSSSPKLLYNIYKQKNLNKFPPALGVGQGMRILNIGQVWRRSFSTNNVLKKDFVPEKDLCSEKVGLKNKLNKNLEDIFNEIGIIPEIWWENLNDNKVVNEIRSELKGKSGIYIIINKVSRQYYVGSAHTNHLYTRFRNHLIGSGNKGSVILKKAVKKYGIENFVFGILEFYPFEVKIYNNKELYALETSYISLLAPSYNIMLEAGQFFGFKNKEISINNDKNLINLSVLNERKELLNKLRNKHLEEYKLTRKIRTDFSLSSEGLTNIKKVPAPVGRGAGRNKRIYLSNKILSEQEIIENKGYLCWFKNVDTSAHYLCCSRKTIQRALNLGFIYIPNVFLPLLNNNHIHNNNSIIEYIDKLKLVDFHYKDRKNRSLKIKSTLENINENVFTKIYINGYLERNLNY